MVRSVEEQVEYRVKQQLENHKIKFYNKTDRMDEAIEEALAKAPSKTGGLGGNICDIRLVVEVDGVKIPVMIEVKGLPNKLVKLNKAGEIANLTVKGEPAYNNINAYAVNGAVHYAQAIIDNTEEYDAVIAVGIDGFDNGIDDDKIKNPDIQMWYISRKNMGKYKQFPNSSLSVLWNSKELKKCIDSCVLTEVEKAQAMKNAEDQMDKNLRELNQYMYNGANDKDKKGRYGLNLSVSARVPLICGMIMAGLGVPGKMVPVAITDLKGLTGKRSDGELLLSGIDDFVKAKGLQEEGQVIVLNNLRTLFLNINLNKVDDTGETVLKRLYREVKHDVIPYLDLDKSGYLDFTGKLFNVLTDWVKIPDGEANDVVLTPRYITDFMARLTDVKCNDYVCDYCAGTAGFLVSAMHIMMRDAEEAPTQKEKDEIIQSIRKDRLLGIELREDIYMLAVLNMMLMGDGSTNIICGDSLKFDGNYQTGNKAGTKFPATVFLLNPPYSASGKGFVFAQKAMDRMIRGGRAAVLIQENAGSGNGSGNGINYTKEILKKHTLKASIHMADIFSGKAGVQTAIYVFDTGIPHDVNKEVVFIDMSEDGYLRQNRKKSSSEVNLRDDGTASARYAEVVARVLGLKTSSGYYTEENGKLIRDVITLDGNDWTFSQHKKVDLRPTEDDFRKVVADYLAWRVNQAIGGVL